MEASYNHHIKNSIKKSTNQYFFSRVVHRQTDGIESGNLDNAAVGAAIGRPLSEFGTTAERFIKKISQIYNNISVPSFVIMPNHIHLIIVIETDADGRPMTAPTISQVVNQYKGAVTKEIGISLWQKGFYDHIIRSEEDFLTHLQYIEENPHKWENDEYF